MMTLLLLASVPVALGGYCNTPHGCLALPNQPTVMPNLGFGTAFIDAVRTAQSEAHAGSAVSLYLKNGGVMLDTAPIYLNRRPVGIAVEKSMVAREDLFITAKCSGPAGFRDLMRCVYDTLEMMGLDYLDLVLIHWPFYEREECILDAFSAGPARHAGCSTNPFANTQMASDAEVCDSWRALETALKLGKVRAIGLSDLTLGLLKHQLGLGCFTVKPAVLQAQWSPVEHDDELLAYCKANGIVLQGWGVLGGKNGIWSETVFQRPEVREIADAHGVNAAQVALKWSLQRGVPTLFSSSSEAHIRSNLDLAGFSLSDEDMAILDGLGAAASKAALPRWGSFAPLALLGAVMGVVGVFFRVAPARLAGGLL